MLTVGREGLCDSIVPPTLSRNSKHLWTVPGTFCPNLKCTKIDGAAYLCRPHMLRTIILCTLSIEGAHAGCNTGV